MEMHNPDDQVDRLKSWWSQYGAALIAGVVIGALFIAGLNYWKHDRTQQGEAASLLYESLLTDLQQGKQENVTATATTLMRDYDSTPYAGKVALLLARQRFDASDLAAARQHLDWAVKNARETAVQHSARLRLGRLQLEQGEVDAALALTAVKDRAGFDSAYEELRGDALLARGDRADARQAYQAALDTLPRGSSYARELSMKLDNLGQEVR